MSNQTKELTCLACQPLEQLVNDEANNESNNVSAGQVCQPPPVSTRENFDPDRVPGL
jgi:hypothetical protein